MIKRITNKYVVIGVSGLAIGCLLTTSVVGAIGISRSSKGSITKFDAVQVASSQSSVDPDNTCTQAQVYEDIAGMSVDFATSTDGKPSIVNFNLQLAGMLPDTTWPEYAFVRLLVDGTVQSGAGSEKIIASMYGYPENSWQFITNELESGQHTAKLQWRIVPSPDMASSYCLKDSSMVVLHD